MSDNVVKLVSVMSPEKGFENLWAGHPRRDGSKGSKLTSFLKYKGWLRKGARHEDFVKAQKEYSDMCERQGWIDTPYVMLAQTWFTSRWNDEIQVPQDTIRNAIDELKGRIL